MNTIKNLSWQLVSNMKVTRSHFGSGNLWTFISWLLELYTNYVCTVMNFTTERTPTLENFAVSSLTGDVDEIHGLTLSLLTPSLCRLNR